MRSPMFTHTETKITTRHAMIGSGKPRAKWVARDGGELAADREPTQADQRVDPRVARARSKPERPVEVTGDHDALRTMGLRISAFSHMRTAQGRVTLRIFLGPMSWRPDRAS